ncbi:hypothetical protein [Streptomyces sp. NPDC055709]
MTGTGTAAMAPARAALAAHLTGLLRGAGLTWAELAQATQLSVSTLQRTARSCAPVPPEGNVAAFVRGCGHGKEAEQEALCLWRRARIEQRGILAGLKHPEPAYVRNRGDLLAAAAAAYELAGAPPLRTVQERGGRTGAAFLLPLAAAWRIVNLRRLPGDVRQFEAFLRGCGVLGKAMPVWRAAWQSVTGRTDSEAAVLVSTRRAKAEDEAARTAAYKISPRFEKLLKRLSAEEVETVLTAGTAYLVTDQAQRNGTTVPAGREGVFALSLLSLASGDEGQMPSEELARFPAWTPTHHRPAALPDSGVDIVYPAGDGRVMVAEVKRYGGPGRPEPVVAPAPSPSGPGSGGQPSRACRLPVPDSPTAARLRAQPGHALTARPAEVAQRRGG